MTVRQFRSMVEVVIFGLLFWLAQEYVIKLPQQSDPMSVNLTAEPANRSVTLRWRAQNLPFQARDIKYRYRLMNDGYGSWMPTLNEPRIQGYHVVEGLTNGLVYVFDIEASDGNASALRSNEVTVVPTLLEAEPAVPTDGDCEPHAPGDGDRIGKVLFRIGEHEIDIRFGTNRSSLASIVRRLQDEISVAHAALVIGYASTTGNASYNLDLSERRARSVMERLEQFEIGTDLFALAMGERHEEAVVDGVHARQQRVVVRLCTSGEQEPQPAE